MQRVRALGCNSAQDLLRFEGHGSLQNGVDSSAPQSDRKLRNEQDSEEVTDLFRKQEHLQQQLGSTTTNQDGLLILKSRP